MGFWGFFPVGFRITEKYREWYIKKPCLMGVSILENKTMERPWSPLCSSSSFLLRSGPYPESRAYWSLAHLSDFLHMVYTYKYYIDFSAFLHMNIYMCNIYRHLQSSLEEKKVNGRSFLWYLKLRVSTDVVLLALSVKMYCLWLLYAIWLFEDLKLKVYVLQSQK